MRTFRTPVTVKKPGRRPSKGHPRVYHGIFLRFTGTAKNIVYYDVDTGTIKVATHKLHDEFQYSTDRTKHSHASGYIIDLIADDKDKKRYGAPMLDTTIKHLIPTDNPPSTAAAASATAYDMEVATLTPQEAQGLTDSDGHCTYIKKGKYRILSTNVNKIIDKADLLPHFTTPIVTCARAIQKDKDIMSIDMSLDIYDPSITVSVSTTGTHSNLGFVFHSDLRTPTIQDCNHDTPANNIERWSSRFRNATIQAINGEMIDTTAQFQTQITTIRNNGVPKCCIAIAHEDFGNLHTAQGLPQMYFDQLKAVAHRLNCIKYGDEDPDKQK